MDDRTQRLFKLLVESYIAQGRPVSSKSLATMPEVDISSATVRNIMSDLETNGLVRSPHTSAGKVPTDLGLRFFVDSLLSVQPLDESRVQELESELDPDLSPQELATSASKLLSHLTHMTCVVTLPKWDLTALRHIEFLNLDNNRVLVILVLNDRQVHNRVIHTQRSFEATELTRVANFLNREYAGLSLTSIREAVLESMHLDKARMDSLMQAALDLAAKTFDDATHRPGQELVIAGESNLFNISGNSGTVRTLFEAFSQKGSILHLLDRCLKTNGIQLFIGQESGFKVLDEMTLVTSSYRVNGQLAGALGVIGPTRMAYQDVIPVVDVTARMLGAAIQHS
ncbi:MAG: heat-inducible transcriptional repressor HrcA [Proteobacteria bacterium]|nr:heat-inducible transcriptional repressor HrcA [Pseudomonadota bacterium]